VESGAGTRDLISGTVTRNAARSTGASNFAMRATAIVAILGLFVLAGCAGVPSQAPTAPAQPAATAPSAAVVPPTAELAPAPSSPAPQVSPAAPAPQVPAPPPAAASANPTPGPGIAKTTPPAVPTPAKPPAPAAQAAKAESPAPAVAKPKAPPLDLASLEQRLKSTNAIGVLTKLTLKNQVDDLLDQFREFYQGKAKLTMTDLRRSYELLIMKVLSLLQDADQKLASAIVSSREAIWGLLADPKKFATLEG
jgi:hypothetical protein